MPSKRHLFRRHAFKNDIPAAERGAAGMGVGESGGREGAVSPNGEG
ncbi:MAG: hypothetical protein IK000_05435 [Bacteroidaceae bacterium]|nr:hypothetical protein [Bacteroidaceae bacterium]